MKNKKALRIFVFVILVAILAAGVALADDGQMFRRNISKTPLGETEKAAIGMMKFYVPAQSSTGELTEIEYYNADGASIEIRDNAKPLISVYIDGLVPDDAISEDQRELQNAGINSGVSFGAHDAFAALSLDDGTTWKRYNLSESADLHSFTLANSYDYPGDTHGMTFAVAGNKVLAGWLSKYCAGGEPLYALEDADKQVIDPDYVPYDPIVESSEPDLYLDDIWGVAGAQGSVDYTLQGFPEVGEIPYSCVWTARGTLLPVDADGKYDADGTILGIVWRQPERLTSGRRDANRLEIAAVDGVGFSMVWQEDPQGLRPGLGLGPGEGWSGAIVNQQTDIWNSYISWDEFDQVRATGTGDWNIYETLDDYILAADTKPAVGIPMAIPIRLSDNKMCKSDIPINSPEYRAYCMEDFDDNGTSDFCSSSIGWIPPGTIIPDGADPSQFEKQVCIAEDDRVLVGRTGSSRPRINMQGYDTDGDGIFDGAWVIMAYEELKAAGEGDPLIDPIDMGKNIWYHSFEMSTPDMVSQGGMINHPAICPYDDPDDVDDCLGGVGFMGTYTDEFGYEVYETEISRRFNLMTQPISKAQDDIDGDIDSLGVLFYKMGIINQGGPADIFLRRLILPEGFDPTAEGFDPIEENPYAFENIDCEGNWDFVDGDNPNYLQGVCLKTGINVSATTILSCDNGTSGDDCAADFPWEGIGPLDDDGGSGETNDFPKVTQWRQCDETLPTLEGFPCTESNLDDESWENPYDVSKGHRGFIDGDFLMVMYAWSPNWKANSIGNDKYNLYIRRSFDGGETWTTTPASYGGEDTAFDGMPVVADGTTTCENYLDTSVGDEGQVCFTYYAGDFEQARNVSQFAGTKTTVLDPRYSPTIGSIIQEGDTFLYPDDERDPSGFFIVYETGDNTTVEFGEATPLDLFYSRAYNWGDDYDEIEYTVSATSENNPGDTYFGWDWLEHDRETLSGEASITSNPAGTYFYGVWNQWKEDEHEVIFDSDIFFRRVMYIALGEDMDYAPIVSILYVSHDWIDLSETTEDEMILLVGTARDGDHIGGLPEDDIAEVEWTLDGEVVDDGDSEPKRLNYPVKNLQPGWHNFSFRAKDKGDRWSPGVSAEVFVAGKLHRVYFPITFPEPSE